MTMGIENFRDLTTKGDLESRRLRLEGQGQNREIRAPKSVWGRFVSWIKGDNISEDRKTQNKSARSAFFDALQKAYPGVYREAIIETFTDLKKSVDFKRIGTDLRVSDIKKVLDKAEALRLDRQTKTDIQINTYIRGGNLESVATITGKDYGYPQLQPDDKELALIFRRLVTADPRYGHEGFKTSDLAKLAQKAVVLCCQAKKARFDEQYPNFARLNNDIFHDSKTYFKELGDRTAEPFVRFPQTDQWLQKAFGSFSESSRLLGETEFDPAKVSRLQQEVQQQIFKMQALLDTTPETLRQRGPA